MTEHNVTEAECGNASGTAQPATDTISYSDFCKVQMRIGRVVEAADHPNADKLIVLKVNLGQEERQIIAGIKGHYTPEQLVGKNIVVVVNLAPRMMRGLESNGMLLAASSPDGSQVILITPDTDIESGSSVS